MGIFGNLFDFNGDGELDILEKAAEFSFIMGAFETLEEEEDFDEDEE